MICRKPNSTRRLAPVRCSAWLGVAPLLRCANDDALKVCGVVMARDSRQSATLGKPPERATRPALAVTLGVKLGGVMVWCDSVPPNDPSSATRPTRAFDCNLDAMAGFAAAHG